MSTEEVVNSMITEKELEEMKRKSVEDEKKIKELNQKIEELTEENEQLSNHYDDVSEENVRLERDNENWSEDYINKEVDGGFKPLHDEEVEFLYSSIKKYMYDNKEAPISNALKDIEEKLNKELTERRWGK